MAKLLLDAPNHSEPSKTWITVKNPKAARRNSRYRWNILTPATQIFGR